MPARKPKIERIGNMILLKRDQWKDHTATISDYPGLLDEVMKYTWTYYESDHPYLKCGKLNTSLHKFVLAFLYGADQLNHIMVSHNPQFIVNLDVDNIIYLFCGDDGKLRFQSGALEYECADYSVLQLVADNIDGGLDSIQKRWKRYEKNNRI